MKLGKVCNLHCGAAYQRLFGQRLGCTAIDMLQVC